MAPKAKFSVLSWARGPLGQLQVLLCVTVLLGGGGSAYGLHNLAVQLLALLVIGLQSKRIGEFFKTAPRTLSGLVLLSIAVPLVQLVPLPPVVWQALPQRDLVVESYAIAGIGTNVWAPYSLAPVRTLVAFASTIVPFAMITIGATLATREKVLLAITFTLAALTAFFLGAVQLSYGNTVAIIFDGRTAADVLYATFANRNSTGLMFILALCVLVGLPYSQDRAYLLAALSAAVLLALGVILTQSRSSIVLLLVPVLLGTTRAVVELVKRRAFAVSAMRLATAFVALSACGLLLAVGGFVFAGGRAATSFARFADTNTDRPEMWEDGLYAAGEFWPFGAGTGTFDDVFQIFESLEYVSQQRAGRAHSDWIEIAIEGGVFSLVLAAAWLVWTIFALRRVDGHRWLVLGAASAIFALAAQSLVDYPLRSQSLLCIAGLLVALAAPRRERMS